MLISFDFVSKNTGKIFLIPERINIKMTRNVWRILWSCDYKWPELFLDDQSGKTMHTFETFPLRHARSIFTKQLRASWANPTSEWICTPHSATANEKIQSAAMINKNKKKWRAESASVYASDLVRGARGFLQSLFLCSATTTRADFNYSRGRLRKVQKIGGGGGGSGGKIITRNEGGRGWVAARRRSNAPHVRLLFAENKLTGLISFHASHLGGSLLQKLGRSGRRRRQRRAHHCHFLCWGVYMRCERARERERALMKI